MRSFQRSVKPDKYSIFNLTQRVVERIQEIKANVASYHLVRPVIYLARCWYQKFKLSCRSHLMTLGLISAKMSTSA